VTGVVKKDQILCLFYINQLLFNVLLPIIMTKTMVDDAVYWRLYTATLLEEGCQEGQLPQKTMQAFKKYLIGQHDWRLRMRPECSQAVVVGHGAEAVIYRATVGGGRNETPENLAVCKMWEMREEDEKIKKVIREAGILLHGNPNPNPKPNPNTK